MLSYFPTKRKENYTTKVVVKRQSKVPETKERNKRKIEKTKRIRKTDLHSWLEQKNAY